MPPRARVTREMVVDAAVEVVRRQGAESVSVRTVSRQLGCSTQPVMYHFAAVEELKRAAYARADLLHLEFLMRAAPPPGDPLLEIGLNYIRFAVEEPQLFRFLFQSGYAAEKSLPEMLGSPELEPVLAVLRENLGMDAERTRDVFLTLALFVHGYASLLANNALEYDESYAAAHLEQVFTGAVTAVRQEENDEEAL